MIIGGLLITLAAIGAWLLISMLMEASTPTVVHMKREPVLPEPSDSDIMGYRLHSLIELVEEGGSHEQIWNDLRTLRPFLEHDEAYLLWEELKHSIETNDRDPLALHLYKLLEAYLGQAIEEPEDEDESVAIVDEWEIPKA